MTVYTTTLCEKNYELLNLTMRHDRVVAQLHCPIRGKLDCALLWCARTSDLNLNNVCSPTPMKGVDRSPLLNKTCFSYNHYSSLECSHLADNVEEYHWCMGGMTRNGPPCVSEQIVRLST